MNATTRTAYAPVLRKELFLWVVLAESEEMGANSIASLLLGLTNAAMVKII